MVVRIIALWLAMMTALLSEVHASVADFSNAIKEQDYDKVESVYIKDISEVGLDAAYEAGMLYVSLRRARYEEAAYYASRLNTAMNRYKGYYRSLYGFYILTCIDDLGLSLSGDEPYLYLRAYDSSAETVRAKVVFEIAGTSYELGDTKNAIAFCDSVYNTRGHIQPIYFYRNIQEIAHIYNRVQMPQKAYRLFSECADYYLSRFGPNSLKYASNLNDMAYVARFINKESLPLYLRIDSIYKATGREQTLANAINLDNIGSCYAKKGDSGTQLKYCFKSLDIIKKLDDIDSRHYAIVLNNIASAYIVTDRDKHLEYLHRALDQDTTVAILVNLGIAYDMEDDENRAWHYLSQVDSANQTVYAVDYAAHFARYGRFKRYTDYISDHITYMRHILKNNVTFMTEDERFAYISFFTDNRAHEMFAYAADGVDRRLAALCYDYLLMSKSLLLTFNSNIEEIVSRSNDRILEDQYFSLKMARANFEGGHISEETKLKIETEFLERLRQHGNFSDFTDLTHRDIAAKLDKHEAAIEFYYDKRHDGGRLYACVIADGDTFVIDTGIGDSDTDMMDVTRDDLALRIYAVLAPVLTGCRTVCFAADGMLHSYPLENYLTSIAPGIKFHRLSSTRLLAAVPETAGNGVSLFGGIKYNTAAPIVEKITSNHPSRGIRDLDFRTTREGDIEISELPGTLDEVISIKNRLDSAGLKNNLYTDSLATEGCFKQLSGKKYKIIHIATHGFYLEDDTILSSDGSSQSSYLSNEDLMLTRSGLLMAGATHTVNGTTSPLAGYENGVLTSYEISRINLDKTDLAVLAACRTALGDISADGVFGLQRGFKKAGVNSIMMSLWNVNDQATRMFMDEFYRCLISGDNKIESLHKAQQYLRSYTDSTGLRPYVSPEYWAAFILLDALD